MKAIKILTKTIYLSIGMILGHILGPSVTHKKEDLVPQAIERRIKENAEMIKRYIDQEKEKLLKRGKRIEHG